VTLRVYALDDGTEVTTPIPTVTGDVATTFTVRRDGRVIAVVPSGNAAGAWQALLVGVTDVGDVDGGTAETTDHGVRVAPDRAGAPVHITLADD
jgi:hypothetical protein